MAVSVRDDSPTIPKAISDWRLKVYNYTLTIDAIYLNQISDDRFIQAGSHPCQTHRFWPNPSESDGWGVRNFEAQNADKLWDWFP